MDIELKWPCEEYGQPTSGIKKQREQRGGLAKEVEQKAWIMDMKKGYKQIVVIKKKSCTVTVELRV